MEALELLKKKQEQTVEAKPKVTQSETERLMEIAEQLDLSDIRAQLKAIRQQQAKILVLLNLKMGLDEREAEIMALLKKRLETET